MLLLRNEVSLLPRLACLPAYRLTGMFGIYSAIQHGFADYKKVSAWPKPAASGPVFAPFFNGVASASARVDRHQNCTWQPDPWGAGMPTRGPG